MDEFTYSQLRAALTAQQPEMLDAEEEDRLAAVRKMLEDKYARERVPKAAALRASVSVGQLETPVKTSVPGAVKENETAANAAAASDERATLGSRVDRFLCATALRSVDADRRDAGVERYLKHLDIGGSAALLNRREGGMVSHCDTFTQDTSMSSSSSDSGKSGSGDERGGSKPSDQASADAASAVISSAAFVVTNAAGAPGFLNAARARGGTGAAPGSTAAGADDEKINANQPAATAFLFAGVPSVVHSGLDAVTTVAFRPVRALLPSSWEAPGTVAGGDSGLGGSGPRTATSAVAACGTVTGQLWLLFVSPRGTIAADPVLLHTHRDAICDLSWTDDGRCLLCAGRDAFITVWDVDRREKVREIATLYAALSARFLPRNNNFCVVGSDTPGVRVVNLSTGIIVKRVKTSDAVCSITTDDEGNYVFTADVKGGIHAFATLLESGQVRRVASLQLGADRGLNHINYQAGKQHADVGINSTGFGTTAFTDYLAANVQGAVLIINFVRPVAPPGARRPLSFTEKSAHALAVLRAIPVPQTVAPLKCCFCERPTAAASICVASGSEDGCVHVVTANTFRSDVVTTLSPGYPCVILDVSWDPTSTVLIAGTDTGDVVAWRRLRISGGDAIDAAFQRSVAGNLRHDAVESEGADSPASSVTAADEVPSSSVGSAVSALSADTDSNPP
jgi:hypothetical protein